MGVRILSHTFSSRSSSRLGLRGSFPFARMSSASEGGQQLSNQHPSGGEDRKQSEEG